MFCNNWGNVKLQDVAHYSKERIELQKVNKLNYISTENMLSEKGGITEASSLPKVKSLTKYDQGDTLISNIRPYFKKIWYADKTGGTSNDVLVFKTNNLIHSKFLYYYLSQDSFFDYMTKTAKGTKMPRGDKQALMNIKLNLPSLEEQKAISDIFSSLDERIELNNQMNETLEEMAQALFKRWFVDFEFPNDEGQPYRSSGGEMIESELGMIPKGWNIGYFRDYMVDILGGDWGKEEVTGNYNKAVYCLRGADIPEIRAGRKGKMPRRYILEKNYLKKKLANGDLVVEISGGSPTQSTGRITYISQALLEKYDLDVVSTNFCRAITLKDSYMTEFYYFYWDYLYKNDVLFQYENGTTGIKNLDINSFLDKFSIIQPPKELLKMLHDKISIILSLVQANGEENERLAHVRDTLLPKLMSGEIRVSDLES